MNTLVDYLISILLGLSTTVIGVLLIYGLARPKVLLSDQVSYSLTPHGPRLFRVHLKNYGRLQALNTRVYARLVIPGPSRTMSIRIPLSNDEFPLLGHLNDRTPRLLLGEVDWQKFGLATRLPDNPEDLELLMKHFSADLLVDLVASSSIFAVTDIKQKRYNVGHIKESPADKKRRLSEDEA